jgi:hypothetical protein
VVRPSGAGVLHVSLQEVPANGPIIEHESSAMNGVLILTPAKRLSTVALVEYLPALDFRASGGFLLLAVPIISL